MTLDLPQLRRRPAGGAADPRPAAPRGAPASPGRAFRRVFSVIALAASGMLLFTGVRSGLSNAHEGSPRRRPLKERAPRSCPEVTCEASAASRPASCKVVALRTPQSRGAASPRPSALAGPPPPGARPDAPPWGCYRMGGHNALRQQNAAAFDMLGEGEPDAREHGA